MHITLTIELGEGAMTLLRRMERHMADLNTAITDLTNAVAGVGTELSTLVTDLKTALAANNPAAVQAAADAIEVQVKALNDAAGAAKAADPAQNTPPPAQ